MPIFSVPSSPTRVYPQMYLHPGQDEGDPPIPPNLPPDPNLPPEDGGLGGGPAGGPDPIDPNPPITGGPNPPAAPTGAGPEEGPPYEPPLEELPPPPPPDTSPLALPGTFEQPGGMGARPWHTPAYREDRIVGGTFGPGTPVDISGEGINTGDVIDPKKLLERIRRGF